jgi:uroporphyrinogen-III decarboxylase
MTPYYNKMLARVKDMGMLTIVDTDGDVTKLIPWLQDIGVEGVLPLERQAGVDGLALRKQFPKLRMIGHYDKMVMPKGEAAMRNEFERLVPLMKTGGYIPSVDHQTPPGVSLEQYRTYLKLLREYTAK